MLDVGFGGSTLAPTAGQCTLLATAQFVHRGKLVAVQGEAAGPNVSFKSHTVMILKKTFRTVRRLTLLFAACLALPVALFGENAAFWSFDHPQVRAVLALQKNVTHDLMNFDPGVLGTAVGVTDSGTAALVVYVDQNSPLRARIINAFPSDIRVIPVKG